MRVTDASASIPATLSAAQRVEHHRLKQMVKSQWNTQVQTLFQSVGGLNRKAIEWSQQTLYGGYVDPKKD